MTVRHVDTWADGYGVWIILGVTINGTETTHIVKVR